MASVITVLNALSGGTAKPAQVSLPVKSGTAGSILPGYLVIVDGSNAGYCKAAADGAASTAVILGVANSTSTETASADGTVTIDTAPVLVVRIKAKTPGSLTAAMKLTDKYILDVTAGAYKLDQATTTNGIFKILDFDNTTDGNCIATLATNW